MSLKISYPCIGGFFVLSVQIGAVQLLRVVFIIKWYQSDT